MKSPVGFPLTPLFLSHSLTFYRAAADSFPKSRVLLGDRQFLLSQERVKRRGRACACFVPPPLKVNAYPFWRACAVGMKKSLGSLCGGRFQVREVCRNRADAILQKVMWEHPIMNKERFFLKKGLCSFSILLFCSSSATFSSNTCVSLPTELLTSGAVPFETAVTSRNIYVLPIFCRHFKASPTIHTDALTAAHTIFIKRKEKR